MPSGQDDVATGAPDSFYESFRWLDENDGLDLRLGLDDYTSSLREEAALANDGHIGRRPSFRRHLSINKLPFKSSRSSITHSRPGTKDTIAAPSLQSAPSPVPGNPSGHVRRKSKALSLISLNKQPGREASTLIDPAAAHYQDPGARMTLRQYAASPQKFDEALEYGFPSLGEVDEKEDQENKKPADGFNNNLRIFPHDDKSETYSNHSTVSDPDSPKTPPVLDKPTPVQAPRVCTDPVVSSQLDCARTSSNPREMTLRMTLTRQDLRAHEEQIYGWKKRAAVRKAHIRGESLAPIIPETEAGLKEGMERHFAALDQENLNNAHDDGMVKRFWKRVRRT